MDDYVCFPREIASDSTEFRELDRPSEFVMLDSAVFTTMLSMMGYRLEYETRPMNKKFRRPELR